MKRRQRTGDDLLPLEDMLIELLLKALIGQIDAQLLEAVLLEALKAIDVQDANCALRTLPRSCNGRVLCCSLQLVITIVAPVHTGR